jgi:hypothetical protein
VKRRHPQPQVASTPSAVLGCSFSHLPPAASGDWPKGRAPRAFPARICSCRRSASTRCPQPGAPRPRCRSLLRILLRLGLLSRRILRHRAEADQSPLGAAWPPRARAPRQRRSRRRCLPPRASWATRRAPAPPRRGFPPFAGRRFAPHAASRRRNTGSRLWTGSAPRHRA